MKDGLFEFSESSKFFLIDSFEALGFFIEPYLQQGLKSLNQAIKPGVEQFIDVEVQAYYQVHQQRPEILDGLDFALVESCLREARIGQSNYLPGMRRAYRKTLAIEQIMA